MAHSSEDVHWWQDFCIICKLCRTIWRLIAYGFYAGFIAVFYAIWAVRLSPNLLSLAIIRLFSEVVCCICVRIFVYKSIFIQIFQSHPPSIHLYPHSPLPNSQAPSQSPHTNTQQSSSNSSNPVPTQIQLGMSPHKDHTQDSLTAACYPPTIQLNIDLIRDVSCQSISVLPGLINHRLGSLSFPDRGALICILCSLDFLCVLNMASLRATREKCLVFLFCQDVGCHHSYFCKRSCDRSMDLLLQQAIRLVSIWNHMLRNIFPQSSQYFHNFSYSQAQSQPTDIQVQSNEHIFQ